MLYRLVREGLVCGVIILFIGLSIIPNICGSIGVENILEGVTEESSIHLNSEIFYPTDDTHINKGNGPNTPFGDRERIMIRNAYGAADVDIYQIDGLIKFDVSSISSDKVIFSAILELHYSGWGENNPSGRDLNLYRILSNWGENTATWNNQPSYMLHPSTYAAVPSSIGWMSWDITSDVQSFINGTNPNYGWRITDENYWGDDNIPNTYFDSKESGGNIPHLIVIMDYTPPECRIDKPQAGFLYIGDKEIVAFPWTLVIGPKNGIEIQVDADDDSSGIDRVEIYIDNKLRATVYEENPLSRRYEYHWSETALKQCSIQAKAWDKAGNNCSTDEIELWYFNVKR